MPVSFTTVPPPSYIPFCSRLLLPSIREYHRLPTRAEAHALCESMLTFIFSNGGSRTDATHITGVFPNELPDEMLRQFRSAQPNNRENVIRKTAFLADFFILGTVLAGSINKVQIPELKIEGEEAKRVFNATKKFIDNVYMNDATKKAVLHFFCGVAGISNADMLYKYIKAMPEWTKFWTIQNNGQDGVPTQARDNFGVVPMCEAQGANYPLNMAAFVNQQSGSGRSHGWSYVNPSTSIHSINGRRTMYIPHHVPLVAGAGSDNTRTGNNYNDNSRLRIPSIFDIYKAISHWSNKEDWVRHITGANAELIYITDPNEINDVRGNMAKLIQRHHEKVDIAYNNFELFEKFNNQSPFENHLQYMDNVGWSDQTITALTSHQLTEDDFVELLRAGEHEHLFSADLISLCRNTPLWAPFFSNTARASDHVPDAEDIPPVGSVQDNAFAETDSPF